MKLAVNSSAAQRPAIVGRKHMVVAGHYLCTQAGMRILEAGGNAVDAAVAAGLATCVVESQIVGFAGVAPMVIYRAEDRSLHSIDGLGRWPKAASAEFFRKHHQGAIPAGLLRSTVPGAPDAYFTALERFGTISFGEAAAAAIELARDGFAMYEMMAGDIAEAEYIYKPWPTTAAIYLPGGKPPVPGDIFVQTDLAATFQYLADEEAAHASRGRKAGIDAARRAFYRGDIAEKMVRAHKEGGGFITAEDMAAYQASVAPPLSVRFGDMEVFDLGPFSQGPMFLQELAILEGLDLRGMGHNSPAYIHAVVEAIKIAGADREAFYGDPDFVDVPMERLLSPDYAAERRRLIDPDRAGPDVPEHGRIPGYPREKVAARPEVRLPETADPGRFDTSYVCTVDQWGNAVSLTPSCDTRDQAVLAGTGFSPCGRGKSSWTDPAHPSVLAPGKRPRMTPNPAMAVRRDGGLVMPFGSPGGDVQTQAMLQLFLNMELFGMDPQSAAEAPRCVTYSIPTSFQSEDIRPGLQYRAEGQLCLESRIPAEVGEALAAKGHLVKWWGERARQAGGASAIVFDKETGLRVGGTDHRRPQYAIGR